MLPLFEYVDYLDTIDDLFFLYYDVYYLNLEFLEYLLISELHSTTNLNLSDLN